MDKKIKILVVAYNRLDYTKRTIESLLRAAPSVPITVFDNASTEPGMQEWLSAMTEAGKFEQHISKLENEGWGTAVNEGLALMDDYDYVLLSNNDVEYHDGWLETLLALYEKYPQVGVMGVWKHTAHQTLFDRGDLVERDQMPAVGWLMTREHLQQIGSFPEHGPCSTKGGNGEDVAYCIRAASLGLLVAGPKEDVALHIDGY